MLDWLAADLRRRAQRHPLHARQVRLRAHRDGPARPPGAPLPGHRHRRPVGRRRQPVRDQVRPRQGAPRRRPAWPSTTTSTATSRRTATTTTAPTPSRSTWSSRFMAKVRAPPHLPRRRAHPVGADHHLQRGLRQAHRQHPRRPPRRRALRARRQPDERPRPARRGRLRAVGGQAALRAGPRRHLADHDRHPGGPGPRPGRARRQPGRRPRRLHRRRRLPHERQRPGPGDAARTRWSTRRSTRS